ncbi:MAG: DUF1015 domain-containing protein, partial [Bdellovibrionales bacterium]|nr:DUF1015 domain-containing protein [Bdellovibrionales bacterium]
MANVLPFCATRYHNDINLEQVTAPPYDVLNQTLIDQLRNQSPYNAVYLSRNPSKDTEHLYDHIPVLFQQWHDNQILIKDKQPMFYYAKDTFMFEGKKQTREGFFAIIEVLEGKTKVIPHEHTIRAHIKDRLDLMDKTNALLSPIFLISDDKGAPLHEIISQIKPEQMRTFHRMDAGEDQEFGLIKDPKHIEAIQEYFQTRDLLIADGHHRFKTALEYAKTHQTKAYVLAFIVSSADPGLVLSSIHRAVKHEEDVLTWMNQRKDLFNSHILSKEVFSNSSAPFALLDYKNQKMYLYKHPEDETPTLSFQENILEKQMGIDLRTDEGQKRLRFFKHDHDLETYIDQHKALGFWLKPMTIQSVFRVCKRGEILPQKTTYFYPKVLDG